jgi:hypothetical protein
MGKLGFARIHRFSGILRLCVCLVLVGTIILGATEGIAAADVAAGLPVIKVFSGDPLTVPDGGNAVYTFEVYDGTKIQVIENGEIIDEFNGPPSTTSKGKANGRTTNQIRTGSMDSYGTILRASNPNGQQEKKLTIAFATKSKPRTTSLIPPVSDNGTGNKNRWGPQTSAPVSLVSATSSPAFTGSPYVPDYAQCSTECNCLTPDQAAQFGFKQKCSEERCFSDDKQVNSYCYYKTALTGWCCKDGKVTPATQAECKEAGGAWYATEADAIKACEQACWCCTNGRYGQTTPDACTKMGGTCYTTQAQAGERCQLLGWFCSGGKVYQGTSTQATQAGATLYATQDEAAKACDQACWCCTSGRYGQTTTDACAKMGGTCYATQAQASERCQSLGYCCSNGSVTSSTQTQCAAVKGAYYTDATQAAAACPPMGGCCVNGQFTTTTRTQCAAMKGVFNSDPVTGRELCQPPGYCCSNGNVTSATQTQCAAVKGAYYTSQSQATAACQPLGYCCIGGTRVTGPISQSQCSQMGGTNWSTSQERVASVCRQLTYWCCSNGQVYQSKTGGTGCYTSQSQAAANCYVQPKPYIPTPITPTPRTFVPNVK